MLSHLGFGQDLRKYCYTATYPPLKSMTPVTERQVYAAPLSGPVQIYFHFPFCSGRCSFCHFNVLTSPQAALMEDYKRALIRELEFHSTRTPVQDASVTTLYFGGGTPSLLSPDDVARLLVALDRFSSIENARSKTLEIHPEVIRGSAKSYLSRLRKTGITRVSIGVQDFSDKVLMGTHRRHSAEEALRTIKLAQDLGFSVNIDLLAPLPHQTLRDWQRTLRKAFSLRLDSITLYTTSIRESMPMARDIEAGAPVPDEITRFRMYVLTQLMARDSGYEESASRWFTPVVKTSSANRLLEGLQPQLPCLGVGCGAYGNTVDHAYYNTPRMKDYLGRIATQKLPVWRGIRLNRRERLHREMVLSARSGHIRFAKIAHFFHVDARVRFRAQFELLKENGLATVTREGMMLTDKGKMMSDEVAALFVSPVVRKTLTERAYLRDPQHALFEHLNHFYDL